MKYSNQNQVTLDHSSDWWSIKLWCDIRWHYQDAFIACALQHGKSIDEMLSDFSLRILSNWNQISDTPSIWWVSFFWWKPLEDVCNLNVVIPDFQCSWVHWQEPNSTCFPLNQEIPKQKKQFRPFWWGFSFRVFPSSYETCDLVKPRMQAGLSSPHFDELRMQTLGSPVCWGFQGMAMKNWNQWNHTRDSRNCCCFFSFLREVVPKMNLSYHDDYDIILWHLAVLTFEP